jgi:2-polyprenyl-3-methyl-5-hydroxy-6-metoxy-1,4-benzoquinol methylase
MPYSNCSTADMLHPRYRELCSLILSPLVFHRKMWEWIFVMHHLFEARVIARGNRGICFGVGSESLPALFAGHGATITATDAPPEVIESSVWTESGQHAASRDSLRNQQLCPNDQFDDLVTFRYCDINAIDVELSDFDFAWSSCCFEHLGSIEAGMQFVINCVEKCLKPGGLQPATRPHRTSLEAGPAPRDAQSLLRYTPRGPGSRRRLLRSLAKTQSGVAKTMLHYLGRCV